MRKDITENARKYPRMSRVTPKALRLVARKYPRSRKGIMESIANLLAYIRSNAAVMTAW